MPRKLKKQIKEATSVAFFVYVIIRKGCFRDALPHRAGAVITALSMIRTKRINEVKI